MAKNTIAVREGEGKRAIRGKLTRREVALIRELAGSGMSYQEIAARFERR